MEVLENKVTPEVNGIYKGHSLDIISGFTNGSIDSCITSPPYWGLRDYEGECQVWDGDKSCSHDFSITSINAGDLRFRAPNGALVGNNNRPEVYEGDTVSNFCSKCGAWEGQLGLEPEPDLYIKHLCDIFQLLFDRVLKDEGTLWVNIADTYAGGNGWDGVDDDHECKNVENRFTNKKEAGVRRKSLVGIPEKFALEMQKRGWIRRNTIIWHKPNAMPSSAVDRFTVDFEYIYFFSKSEKYYFEQQIDLYTKPLDRWSGNKLEAINDSDWDKGTGQSSYRDRDMRPNPEGKNKRTVWSISTAASPESHFATFPEKLIETPIKAGCPEGGLILDPFFGTGTTGRVARKLNRKYVGIELNEDYYNMAWKNLKEGNMELFE